MREPGQGESKVTTRKHGPKKPTAENFAGRNSPDFEGQLAKLQQELAVALERFLAASQATQRGFVQAHGSPKNALELWEKLVGMTHKENEALDRYLSARRALIHFLRPKRDAKP